MLDKPTFGPAYPTVASLMFDLERVEQDFRRRIASAQFDPASDEDQQALGYLADVDEELRQLRARVEKVWTHLVTVRTIKAEGGRRITPIDPGDAGAAAGEEG